jgi:GTPase SAR1 family protein
MKQPDAVLEETSSSSADPEFEEVFKKVLRIVYKEHQLSANQILVLSSELQRVGVHRLVEEHLQKFRNRQ